MGLTARRVALAFSWQIGTNPWVHAYAPAEESRPCPFISFRAGSHAASTSLKPGMGSPINLLAGIIKLTFPATGLTCSGWQIGVAWQLMPTSSRPCSPSSSCRAESHAAGTSPKAGHGAHPSVSGGQSPTLVIKQGREEPAH